jgi:hypothetical protein
LKDPNPDPPHTNTPRDHAPVVWQKFDAQQARARCYPGRASLADLIIAPFSWPSGSALKSAAEETGFREIRLLTRPLPMVLEGGVEQAVQTFLLGRRSLLALPNFRKKCRPPSWCACDRN